MSRNSVLCENTALPFFSSRSTSYHATRLSFPLLPDDGPICSRFLLRFENLHRSQANSRSRIWRLPGCSRRFFPGIRLLFPVPAKAKLLGCLPRSRGLFRFPAPRLDVKPVCAYACLARVAVPGNDCPFDRSIQIGVIENDKRRIAAQFQGKLLHRGGTLFHEQTAHFG